MANEIGHGPGNEPNPEKMKCEEMTWLIDQWIELMLWGLIN